MNSSERQERDLPEARRLERWRMAVRKQLGSLRHLPALFRLVWSASPRLTSASIGLRLLRASLPALSLYVAKLVIDAIVAGRSDTAASPVNAAEWLQNSQFQHILLLVCIELLLALAADLLSRATNLVDGVLSELTGNSTSLQLMAHAATLDLEQFEDSAIQDQLERARRQVAWRSDLIAQLLSQAQNLVTAILLILSILAFLPWLIVLLILSLIPAFLNELQFNNRRYRLAYARSPERREIDYLRYLGAGAEHAKEVKLFGLGDHLASTFRRLADRMFAENTRLAAQRTLWGGVFASFGTVAYYAAYAFIVWRPPAS